MVVNKVYHDSVPALIVLWWPDA